jgi:hypothetical protein
MNLIHLVDYASAYIGSLSSRRNATTTAKISVRVPQALNAGFHKLLPV